MATIALEGTGATIAFGSSSYVADLISLTMPEEAVEDLDTTHLGTTVAKTSKPGALLDPGEVSLVYDHNPALASPLRTVQTFTVSYPLQTGETTPAKRTFSGYVKSIGGEEFTVDNLIRTNVTIKVSGPITRVAAT